MTTSTGTAQFPRESTTDGRFVRQDYVFTGRITADGSSGFPAEAGRYHLYVSLACPWAHRSIIVLRLLGLEDVIGMSVVEPVRDERGWAFSERYPDPINGWSFLCEAYLASDPAYDLRCTVPCLWDTRTGRIVSNQLHTITIDMETQFTAFHRRGAPDLYPVALRPAMEELMDVIYRDVNDGVYRAGFATTQRAYEEAARALFARLDELDGRLASRRYLMGPRITEADVRLYTTLARFDTVYAYHFKCNLRRLVDYPNLWAYARDLFSQAGFADTTDFDHIRRHYYMTHPQINPTRIVPIGPEIAWTAPHGRGS